MNVKILGNAKVLGVVAGIAMLSLSACDKKAETGAANGSADVTKPAEGKNWTETVTVTPAGGYLLGNPDAPVKLVEYASLTCPHCRDFAKEANEPLRNHVASGKVSWEFRSFALNQIDVAATLLATCQGPEATFKLIEQTYAEQSKWVLPFQQMSQADQQRLSTLPPEKMFVELAKIGSLDTFYRVRGLPAAKAEACLADKAKIDSIVALREKGVKEDNVEGTPTFLINGVKVDAPPTWPGLEPELQKALGS